MACCVQIPRAIGAFYHVWKWHNVQRTRSDMRRCTTHASTDPSYDNRTIASTLKMQIWMATNYRDVLRLMKTKFPATVTVFGVISSEGHIMPPHIFKVGLKVNTWMCWRAWWSPGAIKWPVADPGCGSRSRRRPTSPKRPRLGFRKSATTLYPSHCPLLPRPEPIGLLRLVIRRKHHQHNLPQYQGQPDRRHPPSIRRSPAGACGKGILPVPDPYRGGDWGWRRLYWIDVSSAT